MIFMSNIVPPSLGVRFRQSQIEAHVESKNMGMGTIYIAESALSWVGADGNGLSIPYPSISLHAVSRDLSAFPQECLFLMLDLEEQGELEGEDEDEDGIRELRFVPADKGLLNIMYQSMCDCQALHPDPNDSVSEDDDYYGDEEDIENLTPEGQAQLQRLENMFIGGDIEPVEEERQIGGASTHSVNGHGDGAGAERMEEDQFEDAD